MGHLYSRISSGWFEQEPPPVITQHDLVAIKSMIAKRKRLEHDNQSKKRKYVRYHNANHLLQSTKLYKFMKSSSVPTTNGFKQSLCSITIFKCQLCYQCFTNKDYYLDHMITCAMKHRASIKIVRSNKTLNTISAS